MAGGEHAKHRERMRTRFLEHGLDNFADHEVLELLLFYAVPRGDVNPLAHRLLDEFGSLANVLEAETPDLCRVEGMGEKTAAFLHLLPPMFRRYQTSKIQGTIYDSTDKVAEYLVKYYIGRPREQLSAVLLDNQCRLIRICDIAGRQCNRSENQYAQARNACCNDNAADVVLAHNHPRGMCSPSRADIVQTSTIREMLKNIDVRLVDHIIIAEERWISLASQ